MVKLFICVMLVGVANLCWAQEANPSSSKNQDTTKLIDPIRYNLSKKEFIAKYGIDDTSRALINFYFAKRNTGGSFLTTYSMFFLGEFALLYSALKTMDDGNFYSAAITVLLVGYTLLIFVPSHVFLMIGLTDLQDYSKKQLYIEVINYLKGNGLPEKHLKKIIRNPMYWKNY